MEYIGFQCPFKFQSSQVCYTVDTASYYYNTRNDLELFHWKGIRRSVDVRIISLRKRDWVFYMQAQWTVNANHFQGEVTAKIVHNLNSGYEFWLVAEGEDGPVLGHKIDSEMNHRWAVKALSLTWNHISESGAQRSWCLALNDKDDYEEFQRCFTQSIWESSFKMSFLKAKACVFLSVLRNLRLRRFSG